MKTATLALLMALSLTAYAQVLYDNGPDLAQQGWWVSYGWEVSDSFTVAQDSEVTGAILSLWSSTSPYNPPERAFWTVSTASGWPIAGGESLLDNLNEYEAGAYTIFSSQIQNMHVPVRAGQTYYLTVYGVTSRFPFWIRWGESNGPSQAHIGAAASVNEPNIPSESFQILGEMQRR